MASLISAENVTEHLQAAIQLSERAVYLRFLEEADVLIAFNLPVAAVMVASVAVESTRPFLGEQASEERKQIEKWFDLRNSIAHAQVPTVTVDQAKEMVEGIRRILTREIHVAPRFTPPKPPVQGPQQLRGKYRWVPTSSAEFIRRKADELRLEHDECGL